MHPALKELEDKAGIVFPGALDMMPRAILSDPGNGSRFGAIDMARAEPQIAGMAMDAISGTQPTLVTQPNAGIPAYLSTYVDPRLIEVLVTPNNIAAVVGSEVRKGSWLDETAMFPMVESTGEVSSYDDFSTNGRAGANAQFEYRQSYLYQTFTEWGERELERMGLARIDWAARLNIASAMVLNKFQNRSYAYGVQGLQNYGLLNDPSLSAALTPSTKTAGGTSWKNALPTEILADIQYMFTTLQAQTGSNLEMNERMTLGLHAITETYLANTNQYGLTAMEMIKKVFPNLRTQQAPEYGSPINAPTTFTCQLIVDDVQGQKTVDCSFNEKMRAHRIVADVSSWRQKKTQGTWGTIIYFPAGIVSMSGV